MKFNNNNKKAFSIVEIIIYLAIFTIISIVVINSFIIILASFSTIRTNQDLLTSGETAMNRLSYEIRQAKNVDLTNSIFDSDSSVLRLNSTDGTSYITFDKNIDELEILKNGALFGNLLVQNISLNKLVFRHIITAHGEAVKIEIELQDTRSKVAKTESFYDTVVLRGSIK
ncbi:MAG: prepilin-type N-terminal cleavage/methylation domain-containing protein [Candidatus Paceibacterota bacterium]|jgi:hypothetical protein